MYTYKEFMTKKIKRTRGKFSGWRQGGPLNVWGVVFENPRSLLFVPHYCLTQETRDRIPAKPEGD